MTSLGRQVYIPYCLEFSWDVNFVNHLTFDCSRFYFREYIQGIGLGNQSNKYGAVSFKHLGKDLE